MLGALVLATAACGGRSGGLGRILGPVRPAALAEEEQITPQEYQSGLYGNPVEVNDGTSIFDLFRQRDDGTRVAVNRYLWNASLDVLNFLPVQSVDPFTGVIITGYGTPPGGGQAYRATVHIMDPALEARSLNLSLQTQGGRPVSASAHRAVEDAIMTRARQMRVADGRL